MADQASPGTVRAAGGDPELTGTDLQPGPSGCSAPRCRRSRTSRRPSPRWGGTRRDRGLVARPAAPRDAGPILAFFGSILQGELKANYGITFPWWAFTVVAIPVIAVLGFYGIRLSVRAIVLLGGLEFLIVLVLGLSGLISPGPGGFTFRAFDPSFNPGHIATATGFVLAIVFSVQGLTGWESAVPLAEETASPRRNVPIATMASIVITGVMVVIVIWGQIIGWGLGRARQPAEVG